MHPVNSCGQPGVLRTSFCEPVDRSVRHSSSFSNSSLAQNFHNRHHMVAWGCRKGFARVAGLAVQATYSESFKRTFTCAGFAHHRNPLLLTKPGSQRLARRNRLYPLLPGHSQNPSQNPSPISGPRAYNDVQGYGGAGLYSLATPSPLDDPTGPWRIREALNDQGIFLDSYKGTKFRGVCPQCKGGSGGEKSLDIEVIKQPNERIVWNCHRATCGKTGVIIRVKDAGPKALETGKKNQKAPPANLGANFKQLPMELQQQLANRKITREAWEHNRVQCVDSGHGKAFAFPYYKDGQIVNVKYRSPDKKFWQAKGGQKVLYGLPDIMGATEIVIVEGEMDKLALHSVGIPNCVSVPDGAPARVKDGPLPDRHEDTKFEYLWSCCEYLDPVEKIIIATDADKPGNALAEELARRLGKERCFRVVWPRSEADKERLMGVGLNAGGEPVAETPAAEGARPFRKDANEVLELDGENTLKACINSAAPFPIQGLMRFSDFRDEIDEFFSIGQAHDVGVSTGWDSLDGLYRVVTGELTIVTGVPNSGKSEWIDALLCNLAESRGWSFALCSMENQVREHARKLMEKHIRAPFFDVNEAQYGGLGRQQGFKQRMNRQQFDQGMQWLDRHFVLLRHEEETLPNVEWVINLAKAAVLRYGIRGLVIDPYNELDHQRPGNVTETEYVSKMLGQLKRFAQLHDCHIWFVAHPHQLRNWDGRAPGLYDISGSAHFVNKADNGLVVHRDTRPENEHPEHVQIHLRKVRNKSAGRIGDTVLSYDRVTGRYMDLSHDELAAAKAKQSGGGGNKAGGGKTNGGQVSSGFGQR